jgi:hypothetical protein
MEPALEFRIDRSSVYAGYFLTNISFIETLFQVWFMQDYGLLVVQIRQVSLCQISNLITYVIVFRKKCLQM